MKWIKGGLVYAVSGQHGYDITHCHKPTPFLVDDCTVRIYFGTRDKNNKTRTTFIDLDANDPKCIKYVHDKPVLDLGKLGAFDDSGVNVSSLVRYGDKVYMYFIGVNTSTTVHMRNAIGLAVSDDNGFSFNRLFDGAILDRTKDEPYYTGAVDVLFENGLWKCYYTSGEQWKIINGKPEIYYYIKYATSKNGIDWERNNITCIAPDNDFEVNARPCVFKDNEGYKMYYSRRSLIDFRENRFKGYRAGFAHSSDGIYWVRKDGLAGIEVSSEGWDCDGIAYPYVFRIKDKVMMFYNGNEFGRNGFGYAVLNEI